MLAVNYYPAERKGGTGVEYWLMGAATAVLFCARIVVPELAHSTLPHALAYLYAALPASSSEASLRSRASRPAPVPSF
jgi:hypothetical protein